MSIASDLERFFERALWDDLRGIIVPRIYPLFHEAFLIGSEMGAMQRPARERASDVATGARDTSEDQGRQRLQPGAPTILPYDLEAISTASGDVVASYTDLWWQQFAESTQRQMRAIIARAERLGLTTADVTRELTPLFGPERAQRIAVSELTNLLGMGAQETYRLAGFGQWEWRTVRDSAVDPICRSRDRRRFPITQPFRRAHVNCRCWPVPAGRPSVSRMMNAA